MPVLTLNARDTESGGYRRGPRISRASEYNFTPLRTPITKVGSA
jgi:hypothetical protein